MHRLYKFTRFPHYPEQRNKYFDGGHLSDDGPAVFHGRNAGEAAEKGAHVGLVGKIQVGGDFCNGEGRIAKADLYFSDELVINDFLGAQTVHIH